MREMRVWACVILVTLWPLSCTRAENLPLLKVAFLDIGQGDSIYIEAPNGNQMIVDGGPATNLMTALPKVLPFADHSIDILMVTNPDADHYAGFIPLLKSYSVGSVIEPGTKTPSVMHRELQALIHGIHIPEVLARKDMTITLDTEYGVVFRVLFPDQDVSSWTTNDGSIVGTLSYGTTRIMFTGDATQKTESIVLAHNNAEALESTILKVGHHGSRTSTSDSFVEIVDPSIAVISDGLHNKYGHPHKETLITLRRHQVRIHRTDQEGTIGFVSDGTTFKQWLP